MPDEKLYRGEEDVVIYSPGDFKHGDIDTARVSGPRVVVIGGGTGLSTLLKGLKECTENITAIVAVSDDGGGSGVLRNEMGMLPPGDIRNCIMALANVEPIMESILNYRFTEGSLTGQSFGNLFLAALNGIFGSFDVAVKKMGDVLAITGRVLPVTTSNVHLCAEFENGTEVVGESRIFMFKKQQKCRIKRIRLIPEDAVPLEESLEAIAEADLIVLGPGSLYTSVIPNLLVRGVGEAVRDSSAVKIYVCNVMTQEGETEGYTASEHAKSLFQHSVSGLFDICLVNSARVSEQLTASYIAEGAEPVRVDRDVFEKMGIDLIEQNLLSSGGNYARHDPVRLAAEIMRIHALKNPRSGIYGRYDRMVVEWMKGNITI